MKIPYPLVMVSFKDHFTEDSWTNKKDLHKAPEMCLCVGWLVDENDEMYTIVPCIDPTDPEDGSMGGTWFVLKNCVVEFKVLKKGRNAKKT